MLPWVTSLRGVGASSSIIIPQYFFLVNIEFGLGVAICGMRVSCMYSIDSSNTVCYITNAKYKERRSSIMITIKLATLTKYDVMTSACAF